MPKKKTNESPIHIEIMDWVRSNENDNPVLKLVHHCPSSFFGVASFGVLVWLKKLGWKSGIPDIFIPVAKCGYAGFYIEVKAPHQKLNNPQREFFEHINLFTDIPYKVEVVNDASKGIKMIIDYLGIGV